MKRPKTNYRKILSLLTQKSLRKIYHMIKITFIQNSSENGNVQTTMVHERAISNQEPIP